MRDSMPLATRRRIVSREMKNWKDTDQEDETTTEDEKRELRPTCLFKRT